MVTNDTKTAFLFPGQGSQYPGMALDFLAAGSMAVEELFALASSVMDRDMKALLRDSNDETLKQTDIAQPAITLANLAAASFLRERGILPAACAGHSLGEYAALCCAGIISAADCLRLVKIRGQAMQDAADKLKKAGHDEAGMAAVLGLPPDEVESLIARWKAEGLGELLSVEELYGANFNSPKQVVISGTAAALAAAADKFKEAGARRVIRLQVAGPFHSPLMAEAAEVFAPALEAASFADPSVPCFSNVSGKVILSGAEAKALAQRQITEPVRWMREEAEIAALNPAAVLETGPGKVLQGLWKDANAQIPCYAAGTVSDIEALRN
jgi:[acyl-carrier-protein] S-malonyltransferase